MKDLFLKFPLPFAGQFTEPKSTHSTLRSRWARAFQAAVLSCLLAAPVAAQEARVGIVSEEPTEGTFVQTEQGYMVPYTMTIPGTDVSFEMVPIPGGEFTFGTPESEADRGSGEGPQVTIVVEPFWMGKHEVTWAEYKRYMALHDIFKGFQTFKMRPVSDPHGPDVITAPSNLYDPTFTYEAGEGPNEPAATMTQYAAKQYTKWLSLLSHDFYRLPTEAEWEYAARAGTTTTYFFGDDPEQLGEYAWFEDNADSLRHDVGQLKPNPFGLYDIYGNVAEWVVDQYDEQHYGSLTSGMSALEAIRWPDKEYPRVVRGGSFELTPAECRSGWRLGSDDEAWKIDDPNVPKSPWWYTTYPGTGVGFRLVRPLSAPEAMEEREKFWKADVDYIEFVADHRIDNEGRGARGIVDDSLPAASDELKEKESADR